MSTMRAARLHEWGGPFKVEEVKKPSPGPRDVIIKVEACNLVPNLANVISVYPDFVPAIPLPELPAILGLDAAGTVVEVGDQVRNVKPGDRVYLNPGRDSGDSEPSRRGDRINDPAFTFQGYFGFGEGSSEIFKDYPEGGLCEYQKAPADGVVILPEEVSFEEACRFGYLGTAYSALRKAGVGPNTTVLVNGGTGTLGVGTVLTALAMGATKVLAVGRNRELLERVRNLDPRRVFTLALGDETVSDWVRSQNGGYGADAFIDAVGHNAPKEPTLAGFHALRRGGRMVDIGGMFEDLPLPKLMAMQISVIGSLWFSVAEGQDLAAMAAAGTLDLSVFEHEVFPLEEVNEALASLSHRHGGFTNVVVRPSQ